MVYHRVKFLFLWEIPMQNMRTTSFEAITWWPIEISVKFQKRLIANKGSPIGSMHCIAMLCIAYAHSAYDYARLMWIAVEKQCALPVYFFPEQQFDICCFRSVMKGLLPVAAPALCDWGAQGGAKVNLGVQPHLHNSCDFDGIIFFWPSTGVGGGLKGVIFPSRAKSAKLFLILLVKIIIVYSFVRK